jgi:disulfide bond formation protein DsbB
MKFKVFIQEQALYLSFSISLVAMIGSLYFSEIMKYPPCTYCWYQRILMYPLVLILGIAAVHKDYKQSLYVMPLALLGIGMSGYHFLTQKIPDLSKAAASCGIIPCTTEYINWLGFITIPFLAFIAFTIIFILQFSLWRVTK